MNEHALSDLLVFKRHQREFQVGYIAIFSANNSLCIIASAEVAETTRSLWLPLIRWRLQIRIGLSQWKKNWYKKVEFQQKEVEKDSERRFTNNRCTQEGTWKQGCMKLYISYTWLVWNLNQTSYWSLLQTFFAVFYVKSHVKCNETNQRRNAVSGPCEKNIKIVKVIFLYIHEGMHNQQRYSNSLRHSSDNWLV